MIDREKVARAFAEAAEEVRRNGPSDGRFTGWRPARAGHDKVTRIEVIDEMGRVYVRRGVTVEISYQDEGRTLKVFVAARKEGEHGAQS